MISTASVCIPDVVASVAVCAPDSIVNASSCITENVFVSPWKNIFLTWGEVYYTWETWGYGINGADCG